MIGIMLALQVSNWNQNRTNTIKEKIILGEFKANLEENLKGFKENIEWEKNRITGAETILNYFDKKKSWDDSLNIELKNLRLQEAIVISSSAYESLKSSGFDLVSNEDLRKSIIKLYETTYQRWENVEYNYSNELLAVREPIYHKYFSWDNGNQTIVPNDKIKLLENIEIRNMISHRMHMKNATIGMNYSCIYGTESLLEKLNSILERVK